MRRQRSNSSKLGGPRARQMPCPLYYHSVPQITILLTVFPSLHGLALPRLKLLKHRPGTLQGTRYDGAGDLSSRARPTLVRGTLS